MLVKRTVCTAVAAQNRPSFFAAPVAWAVANFAGELIEDDGGIASHHTGLIVISDECSLDTICELSRSAAGGTISPLRFAGSSPSIVAGLAALRHDVRGPTLCLTMRPEHAGQAVLALVDCWTRHCGVAAVIVVAHTKRGDGTHSFRGLIARSTGDELERAVAEISGE